MLALFFAPIIAIGSSFADIEETSPYYQAVESLYNAKVISGYDDGTFRPDQKVNRAEALKMVLAGANVRVEKGLYMTGFKDVPLGIWYGGFVMTGMMEGIISGNPDGTFAGARNVNKAEFIKMAIEAFKIDLSPHRTPEMQVAGDIPPGAWFEPYFSYGKLTGLAVPDNNYNLTPGEELTRGECALLIYKMANVRVRGDAQLNLNIAEARLIEAIVQIGRNEFVKAVEQADLAIKHSSIARDINPLSTTAESTWLISQAFGKIISAYREILLDNQDLAKSLISEAKALANEAVSVNESARAFAEKVNRQGDFFLSLIE